MSQPRSKILLIFLGIPLLLGLAALVLGFLFKDNLLGWAQSELDAALAGEDLFLDYTLAEKSFGGTIRLKLTDITSWKTSERKEPAAHLTSLDLAIPLWATLRDRNAHLKATTEDATLTVHDEATGSPAFENLSLELDYAPGSLDIRDLSARFQGLAFQGTVRSELPPPAPRERKKPVIEVVEIPEEPKEAIPSALDFSPVLSLAGAIDFRDADFQPAIELDVTTAMMDDGAGIDVELEGDTVSFPGPGSDLRVEANLAAHENGDLAVRSARVSQGEAGSAEGALAYSAETEVLTITKLTSNLDWIALGRSVPGLADSLDRLQWETPPRLDVEGTYALKNPAESSDLRATLRGLSLAWSAEAEDQPPLELNDFSLDATLQAGELLLSQGVGAFAGGTLEASGTARPFAGEITWTADLQGSDLSLPLLSGLLSEGPYPGVAHLKFQGNGSLEPDGLQGSGELRIEESKFLDVPILGPLVKLLATVVPAMSEARADSMGATFTVKNGLLTTPDLSVGVSAAQVEASGEVDLVSQETRFEAVANLRGLLGQFTSNVSNALRIEGGGTIGEVTWRFQNLDRASAVAQLLRAATTDAGVAGETAGTMSEETSDELIRAGEKAAKKLGDFFKELNEASRPATQPAEAPATPPGSE